MSEPPVIRLSGVGKTYSMFASRNDRVLDAFGLSRFLPSVAARRREFWALRGIDLAVDAGRRVGVVGRNGAGKSTLLKLITGNLAPSEGEIEVNGDVHALLEVGAGFHPEFTGDENVRAALTLQGLNDAEIEEALLEISAFTELAPFLAQPFRTYSSGMQARLAFATATTLIRPKILIVDEVLGAGDAYFLSKCRERMEELVNSGATVLLVSHSLDHITSMCDEALWIDRGRVVKRGPALEIVKAYQEFLRVLEDRRLRAKNRKVRSAEYEPHQYDGFGDTLIVQLTLDGPPGGRCDVNRASLFRAAEPEDQLMVGHAQDANPTLTSYVMLDGASWSAPEGSGDLAYRRIAIRNAAEQRKAALAFNLFSVHDDASYSVELRLRTERLEKLGAEVLRNGASLGRFSLATTHPGWVEERLEIGAPNAVRASMDVPQALQTGVAEGNEGAGRRQKRRWPGEGTLAIEDVHVRDAGGRERATFNFGDRLDLVLSFRASRGGSFDVIPAAVLYRLDGVLVCRYVGEPATIAMEAGEAATASLTVDPLRLGNGNYVLTVALYRVLDLAGAREARFYDLLDRSYEFSVEGTPPLLDGIFHEPGVWRVSAGASLGGSHQRVGRLG